VALRAGYRGVLALKRPMRVERVVELGVVPVSCIVASAALARKAKLNVRGILAVLEVGRMAGVALRGRSGEAVVGMAGNAVERCVGSGKCVAGVPEVIELGAEPVIHGMTALARGGELHADVVDDGRAVVLLVAGIAIGGEARELTSCRVLMALIAGSYGVSAYEREAVGVIANLLRDLPSRNRVAAFAICAELTAMNVCVAICTVRACVLEDQACVALHAANFGVHAAQRISCLIVVELRV
jgi:hypothetical protein